MMPVNSESISSADTPMSHREHRNGGSVLAVLLGCLLILVLLGVGLWLASRLARRVGSESREQAFTLKQDLANSMQEGSEEARRIDDELASELDKSDRTPSTVPPEDRMLWLTQVNEFLTREVLVAPEPGDASDRPPTLRDTLNHAVDKLNAGAIEHPVVEAAVRTSLVTSYLSLMLIDDAAWQGELALETMRKSFGERHPYTAQAIRNMGALRMRQGRFDDAADLFQTLYDIEFSSRPAQDPQMNQLLEVMRRLRDAGASVSPSQADRDWPPDIEILIEQAPSCCSLKTLEF